MTVLKDDFFNVTANGVLPTFDVASNDANVTPLAEFQWVFVGNVTYTTPDNPAPRVLSSNGPSWMAARGNFSFSPTVAGLFKVGTVVRFNYTVKTLNNALSPPATVTINITAGGCALGRCMVSAYCAHCPGYFESTPFAM